VNSSFRRPSQRHRLAAALRRRHQRLSFDTKKQEDNAVSIELYYVEQPSPSSVLTNNPKPAWRSTRQQFVFVWRRDESRHHPIRHAGRKQFAATMVCPSAGTRQFAPGVVRYAAM